MRCQDKMVLLRTLIGKATEGTQTQGRISPFGPHKNQTPKELDSNRRRSESGGGNHIIYLRNSPRSFCYTSPRHTTKALNPCPSWDHGVRCTLSICNKLCVTVRKRVFLYTCTLRAFWANFTETWIKGQASELKG